MKRKTGKWFAVLLSLAVCTAALSTTGYAKESLETTDVPSPKAQRIIDLLNASDDGIPQEVTKEDMDCVIMEGGQPGAAAIDRIARNAPPVPFPEDTPAPRDADAVCGSETSYQYDCSTGEVEFLENQQFESTTTAVPALRTGPAVDPLQKNLRDYPFDWTEPNPQNYHETRNTCKLLIQTQAGTKYGSGFMISNSAVGTAGHCIYNNIFGSKKWCDYIIVVPASRVASPTEPYGRAASTRVEVGGNWMNWGDQNDDWGVIELNRSFSVGYLGLRYAQKGMSVRAQGYPDFKNGLLFRIRGTVLESNGRYMKTADIYSRGMSGGPVLDDGNYIVGILEAQGGRIVRFDDWLYNKMASYR